jgi:hypothetical protein
MIPFLRMYNDFWNLKNSNILKTLEDDNLGFIFGEFVFATKMFDESMKSDDGKAVGILRMDIAYIGPPPIVKLFVNLFKRAGFLQNGNRSGALDFHEEKTDRHIFLHKLPGSFKAADLDDPKTIMKLFRRNDFPLTDLSLEEFWYRKNKIYGTRASKKAWSDETFQIIQRPMRTIQHWREDIMPRIQVLENEETFNCKLVSQKGLWITVFREVFHATSNVEDFITWNKEFGSTEQTYSSIPKFLLAVPKRKKDYVYHTFLEDVAVFAVTGNNAFIWRCPWTDSLQTQHVGQLLDTQLQKHSTRWSKRIKLYNSEVSLGSFTILNETTFKPVTLQGKLPRTCEFFSEAETEYDLESFVEGNCDCNIVFFLRTPAGDAAFKAVCMKKSDVVANPRIFYECNKENTIVPDYMQRDLGYVRLDLGPIVFMSQTNFDFIAQTDHRYFVVDSTNYKMAFSISKEALDGSGGFVSADHCQAGSDKTVSFVFPVDSHSIEKVIEVMRPTHVLRLNALTFNDDDDTEEHKEGREQKEESSDHSEKEEDESSKRKEEEDQDELADFTDESEDA